MSRDGRHRPDQPKRHKDLPVQQGCRNAADVAGEIHDLDISRGGAQVQLREIAEDQNQECSRPRSVESVIGSDDQGGKQHDCHLLSRCDVPSLLREAVLSQDNQRHQRQHEKKQPLEVVLIHRQLKLGAEIGSDDRQHRRWRGQLPVHKTAADEAGRGNGGPDTGRELVCPQRQMRRKAGKKIGRKRDHPASARDAVHHRCKKHADRYEKDHFPGQIHRKEDLVYHFVSSPPFSVFSGCTSAPVFSFGSGLES